MSRGYQNPNGGEISLEALPFSPVFCQQRSHLVELGARDFE
jgi:hypothetical protein